VLYGVNNLSNYYKHKQETTSRDYLQDICKNSLKIPKGKIRIRKLKKERQYNGQNKTDKSTNNDLKKKHYTKKRSKV
jgi:hypothetical protein